MKTILHPLMLSLVALLFTGCASHEYMRNDSFKEMRTTAQTTVGLVTSDRPATAKVNVNGDHWGSAAQQYRWVSVGVYTAHSDTTRRTLAIVPDEIPQIRPNDLLEVWFPDMAHTQMDQLKDVPVVLRVVCPGTDTACIRQATDKLGRHTRMVTRMPPDLSVYTFSKYFDRKGKPLPAPEAGAMLQLSPALLPAPSPFEAHHWNMGE